MKKPPQDDHYQNQMTKSYISCYNMPYKDLQHFEVPEPVYIYIRQLENEIINRNGAVQRLYDFRFDENYGGNTPIVPDETMEKLLKDGVKKMKGTISKLLEEILRNPDSRKQLGDALIDRTKTINHNGKSYKIRNVWDR